MSHSLNEIEAMAKKASRGAGMSWGLAEEAGRAVRWLASHDLPGVALLADLLKQNDNVPHHTIAPRSLEGIWRAPSGTLCPIIAGAALNDCADQLRDGSEVEMENVSSPLLAVPFAAWAALHVGQPVAASFGQITVASEGYGIWMPNAVDNLGPSTMIFSTANTPTRPAKSPAMRGMVDPDSWKTLNIFAHRTYAPATEASRLLGAGAGTSDND